MKEDLLKILGLNSYESKVLHILYQKGELKASKITEYTGVPNGKIYDVLNQLEHKHLISIIPNPTKLYSPKPLDYLKEKVREKYNELKEVESQLQEFEEVEKQRNKDSITIFRGKRNFHNFIKYDRIDAKTFSYRIKFDANTTDFNIQKYTKKEKDLGIKQLVMYDENVLYENIKYWKKFYDEHVFIQSPYIAMAVNDYQTFFTIINQNTTVVINSESFSHLIKQLYEAYYEKNMRK